MALALVFMAAVTLIMGTIVGSRSSVLATLLPSTAGVRLRERVLYLGQAQFQGVTPVLPNQGETMNRQGINTRQGTSLRDEEHVFAIPKLGTDTVLVSAPRDPNTTAAGSQSTGFNGLNIAQSLYSGVGDFNGTQFTTAPPAVSLCAGNGFLVQQVNSAIAVYSANGFLLAGILPINQFLGLLPQVYFADNAYQAGDYVQDPSCIYDTDTKRFFFSAHWEVAKSRNFRLASFAQNRTIPGTGSPPFQYGTGIVVAVSSSSDPTQPWAVNFIPGTNDGFASNNDLSSPLNYPGPTSNQDNPQLSVDSNGLYISTNQIGFPLPIDTNKPVRKLFGNNIYALSKRLLIGNVLAFEATRFAVPSYSTAFFFTLRPARPAGDSPYEGAAGGTTYFVSSEFRASTRDSVALWVLSNTASLDYLTQDLRLQQVIVPTPPSTTPPPFVAQMTGPIPYGDRSTPPASGVNFVSYTGVGPTVTSAAFQCPKVLFTLSAAAGSGVGVAYAVLKPSFNWKKGTVEVQLEQYQQFGVPGQSLIYPAISMNRESKIIISFSLLGPGQFPSAAYTTVGSNGQISPSVFVAAAGGAPLDQFDGYTPLGAPGPASWGEWQTVLIDERGLSWSAVEYVSTNYLLPNGTPVPTNWATFIFKVEL